MNEAITSRDGKRATRLVDVSTLEIIYCLINRQKTLDCLYSHSSTLTKNQLKRQQRHNLKSGNRSLRSIAPHKKMNAWLTKEQREHLLDCFIAKLDSIDSTFPMEELVLNMNAMNSSQFYNECLEFIPEYLN